MSMSDSTPTPPAGQGTPPPSTEGQQPSPPEEESKSPPYNLIFAIVSVGVGGVAYLLTMLIFHGLIKAPGDVTIVSGALGGLFTLIGTVAGAYFGIKSTQDTTDKADKRGREEAERTERANQAARKALGG
jgi:hypothetical protein